MYWWKAGGAWQKNSNRHLSVKDKKIGGTKDAKNEI